MKKAFLLMSIVAVVITFIPVTQAGHKGHKPKRATFYDRAPVVNVEPIKRTVQVSVPERECWEEEVHYSNTAIDAADAARNVIIGGVIGGVVLARRGRYDAVLKSLSIVRGPPVAPLDPAPHLEETPRIIACQVLLRRSGKRRQRLQSIFDQSDRTGIPPSSQAIIRRVEAWRRSRTHIWSEPDGAPAGDPVP